MTRKRENKCIRARLKAAAENKQWRIKKMYLDSLPVISFYVKAVVHMDDADQQSV